MPSSKLQVTSHNLQKWQNNFKTESHDSQSNQTREEEIATSIRHELVSISDLLSWFMCSLHIFRAIAFGQPIKWTSVINPGLQCQVADTKNATEGWWIIAIPEVIAATRLWLITYTNNCSKLMMHS